MQSRARDQATPSILEVDLELQAIAGSLTAFTARYGGAFVVVYVDASGNVGEASNADDRVRSYVGDCLKRSMRAPELRHTGGGRN